MHDKTKFKWSVFLSVILVRISFLNDIIFSFFLQCLSNFDVFVCGVHQWKKKERYIDLVAETENLNTLLSLEDHTMFESNFCRVGKVFFNIKYL